MKWLNSVQERDRLFAVFWCVVGTVCVVGFSCIMLTKIVKNMNHTSLQMENIRLQQMDKTIQLETLRCEVEDG